MKNKLIHIKFWLIVIGYLFWQILKGNYWHMCLFDFHVGDFPNGRGKRKSFVARKSFDSLDCYWQYFPNEEE